MTIIINKILRKSTLKQNEFGIIKQNEQYAFNTFSYKYSNIYTTIFNEMSLGNS